MSESRVQTTLPDRKKEHEQEDDGVIVEKQEMKQREIAEKVNKVTAIETPKLEPPKKNLSVEEAHRPTLPQQHKQQSQQKQQPRPHVRSARKLRQLLIFVGGVVSLLGGGIYYFRHMPSTPSSDFFTHISLILPVLSPPITITEPMNAVRCFTDNVQIPPVVEQLRVLPCVSSEGRVVPRLIRSDYAEVKNLLLESGYNLLEGLPENGLTTLALAMLANVSTPSMYIDFRQFTDFELFISDSFGLEIQGHLHDVLRDVESVLQDRANDGFSPMLMVFDHFEVALRYSQFQAERFYTWVFDMEHKSLVRAKFLSSDVKLAAAMRELVKWKLFPTAFPPVSKSDVRAYLANVTVLDPKAIERVALHGTNLGIISRIAAQYLRGNDAKTTNTSLDECLKRVVPRSDFLAHLGNFGWTQ